MDRARPGRGAFTPPTGISRPGKFASVKDDHLRTAKHINQGREEKIRQAEDAEFLGHPPPDKELIQVRQHLLPSALDEPEVFDDIRREYRVYITRDEPNILNIRCESIHRLQQALKAINWAVRDMRLSSNSSTARFLAQEPTNVMISDMIRLELGARPSFLSRNSHLASNASAMNEHLPKLASDLASAAEGLMALNKTMGLRVNFGRVIIGQRPRGTEDKITFAEFTRLMDKYSSRGGAAFENRLEDAGKAERLLHYISRPEAGICKDMNSMKHGYEVVVVANGLEIKTEADGTSRRMQLAMVRAIRPELWPRWNWTITAPDMEHDWNVRMDAWDQVNVPTEFKDLAKKVVLVFKSDEDVLLPIPEVNTTRLAILNEQITQIRVKSWAIIPFKESGYFLKIDITKILKGARTAGEPDVNWGFELYAPHWEESMNHMNGGRKDWGKGLENIWEGDGDLKSRLGYFMRTILEVQALLNRAHAYAASS
ncbi:hypothetical protein F53441_5933 [Fusarium austroafricanum]|uniref:Uncharacterized protein n=1 Tax=Fusarium austroafricanum TaxID=2364996 RepID=A0A8H4NTW8_9HYPO|nr:hypothetical protein F53441_5933 [Fusarium austroafricanum]